MPSFIVKEYVAVTGSPYTDQDARIVGPELERIDEQENGLDKHIVVEKAAADDSPLHGYFDWDNKVAGPKWRLHQARKLLTSIAVQEVDREESYPLRAFLPVHIRPQLADDEPEAAPVRYVSLDRILADSDQIEEVMGRARSELMTIQRKYSHFQEAFSADDPKLSKALDVIGELEED